MDKVSYVNIVAFARSLSIPCPEQNANLGHFFLEDECLRVFSRIVTQKRTASGFYLYKNVRTEDDRIRHGRELTGCLNAEQKLGLFAMLHFFSCDSLTGRLVPEYEYQLKCVAKILGITEKNLRDVELFFTQSEPFRDLAQSVYLACEKYNPLVRATGANVRFTLKNEGQIIYMKYFREYNLFLSRTFQATRPCNSITEIIIPREIDLVNSVNLGDFVGKMPSFKALSDSVVNHFPLQTVKVHARDNMPGIYLDEVLGKVHICGSSSPLSPINYFHPVYEWLNNFGRYGGEALEVELQFDYFNSYTSKFILNLINLCIKLSRENKKITFIWRCKEDDEEILEFGKHLVLVASRDFKVDLLTDKAESLV